MIEQQKHTNKIQVQNFGLVEWLKDVQEAIQANYEFDFETNEGYPQVIGTVYTCLMQPREYKQVEPVLPDKPVETIPVLPVDESVVSQETTVTEQETQNSTPVHLPTEQPVKRGPKPKNN